MANILDYLDWRGDLTLAESPFNDVDNFILSQVSTLDFSGFLKENGEARALSELLPEYIEKYGEEGNYIGAIMPPLTVKLVKKMVESRRFEDIRLCFYENRVNHENNEQFAAVTILLPDQTMYISIRGTDDTLAGWKENFNMSYIKVIPAWEDAVAYLDKVAGMYFERRIMVGGHSKGGNLAVYAAGSVRESIQNRIIKVYANDSPGFSHTFLGSDGYLRIRDRVLLIVPKATVVSSFFSHDCERKIVDCTRADIYAHDGFYWEVKGPAFVEVPEMNSFNIALKEGIHETIDGVMQPEDREKFTDDLFDALTSTGAKTLTDLQKLKPKEVQLIFSKMSEKKYTIQKFSQMILSITLKDYVNMEKQETEKAIRKLVKLPNKEKND